ncbi:MAG: TPM domain-containing protein [Verrucomicrobia bacterium]|nr:TPM domain-containing protein [Verrucomicrobiota bacterium]
MQKTAIFYFIFCLYSFLGANLSIPQPNEKRYVDDLTHSLSAPQVSMLEKHLQVLDQKEGVQLIVVIVPSLDGKKIEDVSQVFMTRWQIGFHGRGSGCLLMLSTGDKSCYIELGYGLSGWLNEKSAEKICHDTIDPYLAKGEVASAAIEGVKAIFTALQVDFESGEGFENNPWWGKASLLFCFVNVFFLFLLARFSSSRFWWLSPSIGFAIGFTQSIGLAFVLAAFAGVMVGLSIILRRRFTR